MTASLGRIKYESLHVVSINPTFSTLQSRIDDWADGNASHWIYAIFFFFFANTGSFHSQDWLIYEGQKWLNTNFFGKAPCSHNLGTQILVINKLTVGGTENKFFLCQWILSQVNFVCAYIYLCGIFNPFIKWRTHACLLLNNITKLC